MQKSIYKYGEIIRNNKYLYFTLFVVQFSYIYNLGILNFSFVGENPIRLYDFTGIILIFYFVKYYPYLNRFIMYKSYTKWFYLFILWALFTLIFTTLYYIMEKDIVRIIQSYIYMYHLIIFFIAYVFFLQFLRDKKLFLKYAKFLILLIGIESIAVILQNFGIIPYLWGEARRIGYKNFFSGTLGPNKIVLGMTIVSIFPLLIALLYSRKMQINRIFLSITGALMFIVLIMSGSRTSYIGISVLSLYIFFRSPFVMAKMFFYFGLIFSIIVLYNFEIIEKAIDVYEGRVVNKISEEAIEDNDVVQLYDDLGSGRLQLSRIFIERVIQQPYIIPFGTGFNNRAIFKTSPHNMYLTLIRDVGLIGFFLYFAWLSSYFRIKYNHRFKIFKVVLIGITLSMFITLFFGEHLYIFRPLYALLGLFFLITAFLISPRYFSNE